MKIRLETKTIIIIFLFIHLSTKVHILQERMTTKVDKLFGTHIMSKTYVNRLYSTPTRVLNYHSKAVSNSSVTLYAYEWDKATPYRPFSDYLLECTMSHLRSMEWLNTMVELHIFLYFLSLCQKTIHVDKIHQRLNLKVLNLKLSYLISNVYLILRLNYVTVLKDSI